MPRQRAPEVTRDNRHNQISSTEPQDSAVVQSKYILFTMRFPKASHFEPLARFDGLHKGSRRRKGIVRPCIQPSDPVPISSTCKLPASR